MKPDWQRDGMELYCGDCLAVMKGLSEGCVETVLTDPPYNLGFMGKKWDSTGVAFQPETWDAVSRLCKPGSPLLAFGGTRTHHRLVCAIEDAGWEIRDCLMWLYGSGFPKSLDIGKAIDKAAGAERAKRPRERSDGKPTGHEGGWKNSGSDVALDCPEPITTAAQLWDGWGTALKPAWEPIVLAMKPLDGTFAHNALEHGVAGLAIDACRIGTDGETWDVPRARVENVAKPGASCGAGSTDSEIRNTTHPSGRFPANVILSHHESCVQRGVKRVKANQSSQPGSGGGHLVKGHGIYNSGVGGIVSQSTADADGLETVEDWDCHPECPVRLLGEQSGERPGAVSCGRKGVRGVYQDGIGTAKQSPSFGDTGTAARFFYCSKASKRERTANGQVVNAHPTVKPLDLMRYLVRLTKTPTGGTVLDPFMGSGTTALACIAEGRRFIGIEKDRDSFNTAVARIEAALKEQGEFLPGMKA